MIRRAAEIGRIGAALFLMCVVASALANMLARPLGHPIAGSYEIMGFLSGAAAFLGLAASELSGAHIRVDILTRRMTPGLKRPLQAGGRVLSGLFFLAASFRLAQSAWRLARSGEVSETLRLPFYPVVALGALGLLLLALVLFEEAFQAERDG